MRDSPFVDHFGPEVQFDGAFSGQVPPKSLSTFGSEKGQVKCVTWKLTRP